MRFTGGLIALAAALTLGCSDSLETCTDENGEPCVTPLQCELYDAGLIEGDAAVCNTRWTCDCAFSRVGVSSLSWERLTYPAPDSGARPHPEYDAILCGPYDPSVNATAACREGQGQANCQCDCYPVEGESC